MEAYSRPSGRMPSLTMRPRTTFLHHLVVSALDMFHVDLGAFVLARFVFAFEFFDQRAWICCSGSRRALRSA